MFMVDEETAAAIRTAFLEKGEWAAVVELRTRFKIADNTEALKAVRMIAGWTVAGKRMAADGPPAA